MWKRQESLDSGTLPVPLWRVPEGPGRAPGPPPAGWGDESVGCTLHVGFENKPWSATQDCTIRVFCGANQVLDQSVSVPPAEMLIYDTYTEDPFLETDTKELIRQYSSVTGAPDGVDQTTRSAPVYDWREIQ